MPGVSMGGPNQAASSQPNKPWWAQNPTGGFGGHGGDMGGGGDILQSMQGNSPRGYNFNPVANQYMHTPEFFGESAGKAINALKAQVPELFAPNTSSSNGSGSGGALSFPFPQGGGTFPMVPEVNLQNTEAAQRAAFARAKDQVGQTSRGALTALQQEAGGRGMLGSSQTGRREAGVINQGQQQLGEVSRGQAIENSELANKSAIANYQGGITQRGQTLNAQQNANELALKQWQIQQELNRANQAQSQSQSQSLVGLIGALSGGGANWY